jgi:hypothetical protein
MGCAAHFFSHVTAAIVGKTGPVGGITGREATLTPAPTEAAMPAAVVARNAKADSLCALATVRTHHRRHRPGKR